MIKSCSHFRMLGHFIHLLFSFWNWNGNSIGAGQSRVPGSYGVNNLTETGGNTAGWETKKADQYLMGKKAKQWKDITKQNNVRLHINSFLDDKSNCDWTKKNIPAQCKRWCNEGNEERNWGIIEGGTIRVCDNGRRGNSCFFTTSHFHRFTSGCFNTSCSKHYY